MDPILHGHVQLPWASRIVGAQGRLVISNLQSGGAGRAKQGGWAEDPSGNWPKEGECPWDRDPSAEDQGPR